VPGVRASLKACGAPVVAVSPIIGNRALKGPAAKLMAELGVEPGVVALADHYLGLIDGLIIDHANAGDVQALRDRGVDVLVTEAVMSDDAGRLRLAREVLTFATTLKVSAMADDR